MGTIFFYSGCCNKNTIGLNNKHVFLTVLEAWKSKIKEMADSMSGARLLSNSQMDVFSVHPEEEESQGGTIFYRAPISHWRAAPS